ncbi:class I adenylate-forming enzyme family protein [Nocardioides sp. GCM10027113]|uniref:class I adenylate-forming enzyme family protein n=1 Tax=unclassified Nocardioides TaxID=2615069 RepID=UPI0036094D5E
MPGDHGTHPPADPADLADLVGAAAAEQPAAPALVESDGVRLTWAELDEQVSRVASGLNHLGVVGGQRVMVVLPNRRELVTTYLGTLRAQAVAVPVNPGSTAHEVGRMIADSGSRVVVADATTVDRVREALADGAEAQLVLVGAEPRAGETAFEVLEATEPRPVPALRDPGKLAALLYTSGASGRPRAAMLTHRALLANVDQVAAVEPPLIRADDVVLGVLPLFHVYGLNAVLGGVLRHRATLVLVDRFDPQGTLDVIEDHSCTVVPVAPPVFNHWLALDGAGGSGGVLRERLAGVRLVVSGSAALAAEVAQEFADRSGVPVHQGYGLTEAAPVVTSTLCSQGSQGPVPGSVGAALPGIDLRLVDDDGRPPEGDDPGEIWIRGDNLFSGYWPDGADGPDEDGWWATGDVGILDPAGDLVLVDRVKDLVIVSGFNVYPREVEEVLREVDGVLDAAVVGADDPDTGEAVVAYVRAPGADPQAVVDAVRRHCEAQLARFKQPSRIEVVDELPLTVTGKVRKGMLRGLERRRSTGLL